MNIFSLAMDITSKGGEDAIRQLDAIDRKGKAADASVAGIGGKLSVGFAAIAAAAASSALLIGKAISAAGESQASIVELQGAVENAGEPFDRWAGAMEGAVARLMDVTRFGDEAGRGALATLITTSNDVAGSFANLGLTADISAKKHISLEAAADVVGKVMAGNTSILTRWGLEVAKGDDALGLLRERFGGFAAAEGKTFLGSLERTKSLLGEVVEEFGTAIIGTDALGGATGVLNGVLKRSAQWLRDNKDVIQGVTKAVVLLATQVGEVLVNSFAVLWKSVTGFRMLWVLVETGIKQLPAALLVAMGEMIKIFASGAGIIAGLSDKIFKTHLSATTDMWKAGADAMVAEGASSFAALDALAKRSIGLLDGVRESARTASTALGAGGKKKGDPLDADIGTFKFGQMTDTTIEQNIQKAPLLLIPEIQLSGVEQVLADMLDGLDSQFQLFGAQVGSLLGDTLGAAFSGGFANAGQVALQGLGNILTQMGKSLLTAGLTFMQLLPALSNPFTSGPAMILAGTALLALGGLLGGAMTGKAGGGQRSGGFVGTAPGGPITERIILKGSTAAGGASDLRPTPAMTFTIIGEDDPKAQRAIANIVTKAARRNIGGAS